MATNNVIDTSNPIAVASGGTGLATLTAHALQVGAGTSAITQIGVGATGQVLVGNTSADPSWSATPTVTSITFGAGSALSNYVTTTSWTPVLNFGGATTGITYTTQSASYVRIGSMAFVQINIVLSSKGSATGVNTITGFPLTTALPGDLPVIPQQLTYTGQSIVYIANGSSTFIVYSTATGSNITQLADTAFSNTTSLLITGQVQL